MKSIIIDTLLDTVKLVPFLFVAFLIIEYVEHKLSSKTENIIKKSGKYSPLLGSLLGLIPQCGFSVVATNLYITRIISLGTLIAIYLSTSDEMLPIMISHNVDIKIIILILLCKFVIAFIFGYLIDFIFRKKRSDDKIYDICHDEHCGCEESDNLFKSSLIHTIKTVIYLLIITFIINLLFTYVGEQYLSNLLYKNRLIGPLIASLIGLIPNCGASIMITELYLSNTISFASTLSGLLTSSGVALLVLFKSNKNFKENLSILATLYFIGVIVGLLIEFIPF